MDWIDRIIIGSQLLDAISEASHESMVTGWHAGSQEVGVRSNYIDPTLIRIIQQRSIILSQNTADRLRGNLKQALIDGITQRQGIDDISRKISEIFDGLATYEAERIARTETLTAFNLAREVAWQQNPTVHYKMWLAHFDHRTADDSKRLSGQIQEIGQQFVDWKTGQTVMQPPLRPQDRCTSIPLMKLPDTVVKWHGMLYDEKYLVRDAK